MTCARAECSFWGSRDGVILECVDVVEACFEALLEMNCWPRIDAFSVPQLSMLLTPLLLLALGGFGWISSPVYCYGGPGYLLLLLLLLLLLNWGYESV